MLDLRRYALTALALIGVAMAQAAMAVELSPDGQGEVIILPVFAATEQVSTLLTINNTDRLVPKAVRVRLRDRDGVELLAFNLYLGRYDTWAAAITRVENEVRLLSSDASCTVAVGADGVVALPDSLALDSPHGFIEVFEMGTLPLGDNQPASYSENRSCEALRGLWQSGTWSEDSNEGLLPPEGSLKATASIVNVGKGTLYAIPSTVLRNFSDLVQHTLPTDPVPNLASGHDAGTEEGATQASICERKRCTTDEFATPLQAVEAVLMVHELTADFTVDTSLGARSELVVTFPTRHFHPEPPSTDDLGYELVLVSRDRDPSQATACVVPGEAFHFDFCVSAGIGSSFQHNRSLELVSFVQRAPLVSGPQIQNSMILGISHQLSIPPPPWPVPASGVARIGFETFDQGTLSSNSGQRLFGQPAIGIMFLEVTNAYLQGDDGVMQRANYGGAVMMSRTPTVRPN